MLVKFSHNLNTSYEISKYSSRIDGDSTFYKNLQSMIKKDISTYVPKRTGALRNSVITGRTMLTWSSDYAPMVYNSKSSTSLSSKVSGGRLAGPRWIERYMANSEYMIKEKISKEMTKR